MKQKHIVTDSNVAPDVSIVLPAYNEEEAIGKVIDDIRSAMDESRWSYEILVVDDHSEDRTVEIIRSKGITPIEKSFRQGSGASRRLGITRARAEIIAMMDADGTYEAKDIPKLLEFFPEFDQVNGMRYLRMPMKWLIRQLASYLTQYRIPDLNTGIKVFKTSIMKKYLWVLPDGFSCVTTMTLAFIANGYAVKYVPVNYYQRIGRSKFHPIKDTISYIETLIRVMTYFKPLRIFLPISSGFFVLGVLKSIYNFWKTSTLQESDIIIFMFSLIFFALGLIADLIVAQFNRR